MKILTIHNHFPLHEIFINKTADFAPIYPTQFSGRPPNFYSSVLPKSVSKERVENVIALRSLFQHFFHFQSSTTFTMLQKLSQCEVKAWVYWNLIILPPLNFYVKSNVRKFKWSKNVIFGNFRDSELWIFGKFETWNLLKFTRIKIQNL